ncbi:MAG: ornithine carbamoyltransferase [Chloroflexi bacterium]|nr:ornithine carbamoyltransferase [Chloroflexota bacterium]
MPKHLLSIADLSRREISELIAEAIELKHKGPSSLLAGKTLALMFEKPSLRTRVSFEMAMRQLGGDAIYLSPAEVGLGKRESIPDVARVLSRYVNAIAARTFSQDTLEVMAKYASIPVVNALSDLEHPCQALADLLTICEKKGPLKGVTLAYIGDGNNVANSLLLAAALTGVNSRIASPEGYAIQDRIRLLAEGYARESGAKIIYTVDPQMAAQGADVLYTDVWTSMGQEAEAAERRRVFAGYRIDSKLLSQAKKDVILMHPLPAHRGEEVADGILDSPQSAVFDQAENRLHIQKVLLARLLG